MVLKFKPAIATKRSVCLSVAFREKYPRLVRCILDCLGQGPVVASELEAAATNWKIITEHQLAKIRCGSRLVVTLGLPGEKGDTPYSRHRFLSLKSILASHCAQLDHASCSLNNA